MKPKDFKESFSDFWSEYKRQKIGIAGIILLILIITIALIAPLIVPFPEGGDRWTDITYWEDNPTSVPPSWVNHFSTKKRPQTESVPGINRTEVEMGNILCITLGFPYDHISDYPPSNLILHSHIEYRDPLKIPMITIELERPDGDHVLLLSRKITTSAQEGRDVDLRISFEGAQSVKNAAYNYGVDYESDDNLRMVKKEVFDWTALLFSELSEGLLLGKAPQLKGVYNLIVKIYLMSPDDHVGDSRAIFSGQVFGYLGTDSHKRDLWTGIIMGTKYALLVGVLTAVICIMIGVLFGITSAYSGGWVDELMQRFNELVISIPILPVMIVIGAVLEPSIWLIILFIAILSWTTTAKVARSMGLQIKEQTFVESARAIGASGKRVLIKHMIPQVLPYSFAQMALFVPGAIILESSLSLLGCGDTSIVTWGQILHDAWTEAATMSGMWWWIIPPGLAITIVSISFVLVGFAMDTILNPKLRTR